MAETNPNQAPPRPIPTEEQRKAAEASQKAASSESESDGKSDRMKNIMMFGGTALVAFGLGVAVGYLILKRKGKGKAAAAPTA